MSSPKKILLLMLFLLVLAEILFETNVKDKKEVLLEQLEATIQGSAYRVDCGDCDELILPWTNEDGQRYLFLPSSAEKYEQTKGSFTKNDSDIMVVRSSEVPSVFVILKDDTISSVDGNKGYQAPAYVTILNEDGEIEYSKDLEYIKVRGNGTYNPEKKPYEIKLTSSKGLLGMSAAKEWILLANAYDSSLLKNSLVQDFATNYTDLPSAVNKPVDLYINGEYRGSYLLSEKVQVRDDYIEIDDLEKRNSTVNGETEAFEYQQIVEDDISYVAGIKNPKDITGGYLIERVPEQLLDDSPSYFYTNNGTLFKLKNPKYASKEEVCYIKSIFDEVELAVSAEDGINPHTGRHFSQIIDVDSWIQKYLLELVFQNSDMSYASMFYYKDSDSTNSLLRAGTPWDYDLTLLNTRSTDCFPFVNQMYLREELLQFEEVRSEFEYVYEDVFVSFVEKDLDTYLAQKEQELAGSYNMNAIRWNKLGQTNDYTTGYSSLAANVDYLSLKMKASIEAMDKWLYEKDNYCVVSFEDIYQDFLVEKGTKLNFDTPNYADYISLFEGWKDAEGHFYNEDAVVEKDMVYHASTIGLPEIFAASESELLEMDFSNIDSELLTEMIVWLKEIQSGKDIAADLSTSAVAQGASEEEVEIVFPNYDGSAPQKVSVPRGTTLKHIPVPEWKDGIFLRWQRVDNAEPLNENVYMLEPIVYEAEWIYIPHLINNAFKVTGMNIDNIDIEMLERVFER